MSLKKNPKLAAELLQDLDKDRFDVTEDGIVFPRQAVKVSGVYQMTTEDGRVKRSTNLVTKEGLIHLLNTSLGSKAKTPQLYLALFSGTTAPAANWTAANFTSVANEIVSLSEGYTLATRIPWNPADASADTQIDNYGNETQVTFATAATINVTGAALLSASAKGATTGVLVSATLYDAPYTFQNGNTFAVGYRLELTT